MNIEIIKWIGLFLLGIGTYFVVKQIKRRDINAFNTSRTNNESEDTAV